VAGETSARPLTTLDTVGTDTPSWSAISAIVTRMRRRTVPHTETFDGDFGAQVTFTGNRHGVTLRGGIIALSKISPSHSETFGQGRSE
jgi:hypothetical protein